MVVRFRRCEALCYRTATEQNRTRASSQAGTTRLHVKDHQRWVGCINTSALCCVLVSVHHTLSSSPHLIRGRDDHRIVNVSLLLYLNQWSFRVTSRRVSQVRDHTQSFHNVFKQRNLAECCHWQGASSTHGCVFKSEWQPIEFIMNLFGRKYVEVKTWRKLNSTFLVLLHLSKNRQHVHSEHSCILLFFLS